MAEVNPNQETGRFTPGSPGTSGQSGRPATRPVTGGPVEGVSTSPDVRIAEPANIVHPAAVSRVSWGALFAGMFTTLALQLLLITLGTAIGLSVLDATGATPNAQRNVGMAAGIWILLTGLLSLFGGGWVASRVAGVPDQTEGSLHGFLTWGLATVLGAVMLTTVLSSLAAGTGAAAATAIGQSQTPATQQGALGAASGAITDAARSVGQSAQQAANQPPDTSNNNNNAANQNATQSPQTQQRVERAAEAGQHGAWWTFLTLLLGAAAATFGGYLGTPRRVTAVPVA